MLIFNAMNANLYSIRMRSSQDARHISGAERLAPAECLETLAAAMVRRALEHERGCAEQIHLTLEKIDPKIIQHIPLPDIRTLLVDDVSQGRAAALQLLEKAGVTRTAASAAMEAMMRGASPEGTSMRGAMLVDSCSGARLEPDAARGVRVTRMDLTDEAAGCLRPLLQGAGVDNPHVREALVLAAKVLAAPGIVAELCWSDDPAYTTGYVAGPGLGYVRLPHLKPAGEERGGRAFFLAPGFDVKEVIAFLEGAVVLIDRIGTLHDPERWRP